MTSNAKEPTLLLMRTFFALDLTPAAKLEIATWRERSFRELATGGMARPVHPGNFHITLAFVGDVTEQKLERLCDSVEQWLARESPAGAVLVFDELGYWQRQGILWLGLKQCPAQLSRLANRLKGLGTRVGGKRDNKAFQPHITLFRRCQSAPPPPLEAPEFSLDYGHFALFESRQGKRGVSYHALQHWQLRNAEQ